MPTQAGYRRIARAAWALIALLSAAVFAQRAWVFPGTDAEAYYHAGLRALRGVSPYVADEPTPFKYLPVVAYLFIPLAWLPFVWAKIAVFASSWAMAAALYARAARRLGALVALALFAGLLRFHNYDFLNLQINHWILFLLALAWLWRDTRPWLSAWALSLAVAFKVLPVFLLGGLFVAGRWRLLARACVALVALLALPTLLMKPGARVYLDWYQLMAATTPWPAPVNQPILQSIPAALWNFWPHGDPRPFARAMFGLQAAMIGLSAGRLAAPRKGETAELAPYAALLVAGVLFSPMPWKHAYLLTWPGYFVFLAERRYAAFGVAFALMSIVPTALKAFPGGWWDWSYVTVLGAICLWAALVFPKTRS